MMWRNREAMLTQEMSELAPKHVSLKYSAVQKLVLYWTKRRLAVMEG